MLQKTSLTTLIWSAGSCC